MITPGPLGTIMDSQEQILVKRASIIAGATLVSRVLGFIRDVIIAFALGAGPLADAFFVAFRIPNLLRRLFAEGSLTLAFVPVFSRTRQEQGIEQAFSLTRSVMLWLVLIVGLICCLAIVWAKPLTMLIAPGFSFNPQLFEQTVLLVRLCFPYILFISAVALCMGFLNSMGHFFAPALAPCLLNCLLIVSALFAVWQRVSVPIALSVAVILAGISQFLLQQPFMRQFNFSWVGSSSLKHPGVKKIGRLMLPTVWGAAVYQLNIITITVLASFLPQGSISYLYYADRLVQFPLGVFGIAVSTAALPSLSRLAVEERYEDFVSSLNTALGVTVFISLPAMAGLIGLRSPLIEILFVRGAFDSYSASLTAQALVGYSLGLPAFSGIRSLVSAFYAHEDTRTPVLVATLCFCINLGLALWLMDILDHLGLALAVALTSWVNIGLLGMLLKCKIGRWFHLHWGYLAMVVLSCLIGLGSYWTAAQWGWLALCFIPAWAVFYGGCGLFLRLTEARLIWEALWMRFPRKTRFGRK